MMLNSWEGKQEEEKCFTYTKKTRTENEKETINTERIKSLQKGKTHQQSLPWKQFPTWGCPLPRWGEYAASPARGWRPAMTHRWARSRENPAASPVSPGLASPPAPPTARLLGRAGRWNTGAWLVAGLCSSREPGWEPSSSALPRQRPAQESQLLNRALSAFAWSTAPSPSCQHWLSAKEQWVPLPLGCHHPGEAAAGLNLNTVQVELLLPTHTALKWGAQFVKAVW